MQFESWAVVAIIGTHFNTGLYVKWYLNIKMVARSQKPVPEVKVGQKVLKLGIDRAALVTA